MTEFNRDFAEACIPLSEDGRVAIHVYLFNWTIVGLIFACLVLTIIVSVNERRDVGSVRGLIVCVPLCIICLTIQWKYGKGMWLKFWYNNHKPILVIAGSVLTVICVVCALVYISILIV